MAISIDSIVTPIFVGSMTDDGEFIPVNIQGTAFSIGKNFFLTAGHVLEAAKDYNSLVLGFIRDSWLLELTAKVENVAYHTRKMWIDTERYIPLKQEM